MEGEGVAGVAGEGTYSSEHFAGASLAWSEASVRHAHAGLVEGDGRSHVSARCGGRTVGDISAGCTIRKSTVGYGSTFGLEEDSSGDSGLSVQFTSSVFGRGGPERDSDFYSLLTSAGEDFVVVVGREGGVIEHARRSAHAGHRSSREVLVELRGAIEHIAHIGDLARIPATQGLIEVSCTLEHAFHTGHFARIPRGYRLIEGRRSCEHSCHDGHAARISATQGLIEGFRSIEHMSHIRHATRIPRG